MTGWLSSSAGGRLGFETTQWSLIAAAAGQTSEAQAALEDLYRTYCYPVYSFVRRRGYSRQDAQDLTHDFFVHLMEKNSFRRAEEVQGRFRAFLLRELQFFLRHRVERTQAEKRGGKATIVFLDEETAEAAYQLADPGQTAEEIFDTRWAALQLDSALSRLKSEMEQAGKRALFEQLFGFLVGGEELSYTEAAQKLGLTLPATKAAIFRLRTRYRELFRAEVARTVSNTADFEEEIRALRFALLDYYSRK
jgi:RNA polymerase sigma factor (sigma-70 family)